MRFHSIFFTITVVIVLSGLWSCQNKKKQPAKEKHSYVEKNSRALSADLQLNHIQEVRLSSQSENAVSSWINFMSLQSEINKFDGFTLQNLVENSDNLLEAVKSVQDSIPSAFNNQPVQSRLNVLATKAKVLNQNGSRSYVDTTDLQQNGKDIYGAFQNLKIQLNEVFLQDLPEFGDDFDEEQDSIQRVKRVNR